MNIYKIMVGLLSKNQIEITQKKEIKNPIDWEQRRYEIAKAILTGYSSGEGFYSGIDRPKEHCERAIMYADELIRQLKASPKG